MYDIFNISFLQWYGNACWVELNENANFSCNILMIPPVLPIHNGCMAFSYIAMSQYNDHEMKILYG